jgi:alpha-tubulin suppressor-like RCC1 family protein
VRCWGNNGWGQVGNGTMGSDQLTPVAVTGLSNVVQIAGGLHHYCARRQNGSVACWGSNNYGQIGTGSTSPTEVTLATDVIDLTSVVQIVNGESHSCARRSGGTVWCWGSNEFGQMGDGGAGGSQPAPIQVLVQTSVDIISGALHLFARSAAGSVQGWGFNLYGQLGNGTTVTTSGITPAPSVAAGLLEMAAGDLFTCARYADQTVRCWGSNGFGQLGTGDKVQRVTPTLIVPQVCTP